jgi:hypothetical protein
MITKRSKILVACEESQAVTKAFRARGFEAFSCDIQPCSGGHPDWHIQDNVLNHLDRGWDLMIGHPECTYLANSGVSWLHKDPSRWEKLDSGAQFFKALMESDIPRIALENPIPHKYAVERIGRKYTQIIQPWMFGHAETKATCLWLKNLPKLQETNNVKDYMLTLPRKERLRLHYLPPSKDRAKIRSKTYPGIADAIASQYGDLLE